ncbi:MAG: hypothetical protein ACUVSK_13290, partial [Desulfotomaculales bacterium]
VWIRRGTSAGTRWRGRKYAFTAGNLRSRDGAAEFLSLHRFCRPGRPFFGPPGGVVRCLE